ncbi:zinc metalloprotease ZmpB [Streptococcus pneumoniae]|uniref:ZmpA/ZmpB/ZmpC family metallo-endopeptidase n=1 Tax=Streptococcus pneumoniae TaxID=1313 RepID=UPI000769059F|nr:ZmpA/ZmpB/ZmpC family metallo-endopeptidase [Streptococcus pneumoniae]MBW8164958.1 FIVAR domain-containing protein [Streptococcus pneumoniae]MDG7126228.1 ZmpA/ZmpB/ZmpC family metallo-endopeptidase [Streptococcus pneumoniae]MDG7676727.1 ZmpA/ZmpB/ZmpC family metallo-endopeptidase [Streptococcus pneumoniae]MDG8216519.1 ZmpA/ZmpB/ZmpC family metallo-endopeptidase [Streptococcus pneumoniae]MDG8332285.1 ZmpA/ZmpB/ZmpC family metallo-endopeptidase [Streptococcus pneumoniae]
MFKKDRFSIRKIKGVVGSVFLGSLLMAPSVVDAATYHYVNKEIISQEAKDLIQTGKPDRNEVVYGLVYQKDQLPQTGTEASVLTAFGLLTVGSLLLIYKRKKIASVFLVGAMGLVVLPSAGAVDPVATLALASREGVVEMDGYRYVGYLSGDILKTLGLDTVLEETSAKPGEVTVVEVETPQSTTNQEQARTENQVVETEEAPKEEAPRTEESPKEEPKSEVKPTDDTLPKVEEGKEDSAEPAPVEEVGGEVESKPEEKVAVKPESQPSDKPAEESKVEQAGEPVAPRKDEQAPVEPENQPEAPEEEKAVEETPKQEESTPDTKAEETVEPKEETVNQSVEQPKVETPAVEKQTEPTEEPKVEQAGEPVAPREDEQAPTAPVEPEKQPEVPEEEKAVEETPKPEDKIKGIGTKEPVDKSELNNQIDKASSVSPTDYSTASYNALGPVLETAKGVYASEPVKQPEVNSETNKLKTAIDALNVDKSELQEQLRVAEQKQQADYSAKTWREFKIAELQAKEINNQTTPLPKQSEIDAATKALQDALQALAVDKTVLQNAINTANSKREEEYTAQTWKALEDALTAVNPVNEDETATQSKVDEATRNLEEAINNLVLLTEKPVLTFIETDKKALEREVVAKYSLENQNKTKIKSITATLKKGETVVSTVELIGDDVTNETISSAFKNLEYYKEYTLSTTMVYDRGDGDVTEILDNQPIQLDLKKVEIKNIKETSLISVDAEGNESDKSLLEEKPTDITSYYLKITTHDSKVTRLAVDKIEEVEEGGKTLFKVTATAPDLIQRDSANKLSKTYTHYIAKKKTHKDNVYYDFNELVNAINDNPNGTFKLGADLNATNVPTPYKEYVPKVFRGHLSSVEGEQYSIHNIARQLFSSIEGGSVKNINLANVDINMPWINDISPLARVVKNATVQDVKVTGSILGKDGVAGVVNKVDNAGILTNIAFIGKIEAIGSSSNHNLAGLAGEVHRGRINQTYVNATIIGNRARTGGLVGFLSHDLNPADVTSWSYIKNSVAKGTIDVPNGTENGGLISKDYPWGTLDKNISMVDVKKGDIFFGSNDMDNEFVSNWIYPSNSTVIGVSKGAKTHRTSSKIKEITLDEANEKIKAMGITADKFEIKPLIEEKLNNIKPKADTYKDTQDYKADRELAYRNIEKLQPFYNKEWIVNQGNKIPAESDLLTKEVLSVTGMKVNNFVTDLSDADHIMIHYSDKTKEIKAIKQKESQVSQVREYSIEGLDDIVYTPNIVEKNRDNLAMTITEKLSSFELQSPEVRQILDKRDASRDKNANSEARQNNYIRDLYLEESVTEVKNNISDIVKQLIENEDHQLNTDEDTERALIKKIEGNKAKLMLGLAFLNRYYGVKFGDFNIKQLMMFKPDFYGNNVSLIDRLIEIGSKENNLRGYRTQDSFREVLAKNTRSGNLIDFLKYNMELLTSDKDINDWFIHSTDGKVYVVEKQSREEGLKNAKYRAFDNLSKGYHQKMILPLLNLTNTEAFLISTYNTISFGTANKYGKPMSEMKKEIDLAANRHLNYLDFWYRLANDNVKNLLAKNIVTPVWEGYKVWGHDWPSWMDRYGNFDDGKGIYAPVRELYGPTNEYYGHNGARAGAYATYYDNKNDTRHKVVFVMSDMLTEYGSSAFTHETTHVNDRVVYYGGYGHREGTFVEAFAQGMLQSPAEHGHQGEYGALGLNMAFERSNDGNQWYNYNPNKLQSREAIDKYMKNYNEALMMLDYLEADAVLSKHITDNSVWFKKVDKQYRTKDEYNKNLVAPNQWDRVRDLTDEEKTKTLSTINDLVDNNFATKHGVGNGRYRPEDFGSAYVNVNMMAGIYGGNSSDGAPGALSFKHNAFRMWGYYGYENGFIGYVSNKYKSEANKEKQSTLSDKFIIDKVSGGTFQTLEEWKKTWYGEVLTKAQRGFIEINIDGENISTYSKLQELFKEAVTKDLTELNDNSIKDKYRNTVALKSKIYKQLLKNTDGFSGDLFTAPQA